LDAAYKLFTDILAGIEVDLCKIAAPMVIHLQLTNIKKIT
jgi:hypothetical protein